MMRVYNIVFWPKIHEFRYFVVLQCGSYHTIKNGSTHNGKPKRQCDTKFVALSDQIPYSELTTP
jgi:hypothetical protein